MTITVITRKNILAIVRDKQPAVILGVVMGAALSQIFQSYVRQYARQEPTSDRLSFHRVSEGGWKDYMQRICQVAWDQWSKIESYQSGNSRLCKKLAREISTHHWLAGFSDELGPELQFFFQEEYPARHPNLSGHHTPSLADGSIEQGLSKSIPDMPLRSFQSFEKKQQILQLIIRLNKALENPHPLLGHPHFRSVVTTVVETSLQDLCENEARCIEEIWSVLKSLAHRKSEKVLKALFETHPALLDFFARAVLLEGRTVKAVDHNEAIPALEAMQVCLEDHSRFYDRNIHKLKKGAPFLTVKNMRKTLLNLVDAFDRTYAREKLEKLLGNQCVLSKINMLWEHYQTRWSIYDIRIYLHALADLLKFEKDAPLNPSSSRNSVLDDLEASDEEFMSANSSFDDEAGGLLICQYAGQINGLEMSDLEGYNAEISKLCFTKHITRQLGLKTELDDSPAVGLAFARLFTYVASVLNDTATPDAKREAQLALKNISAFFVGCGNLHQKGYPLKLLIANLNLYFRQNREMLDKRYNLSRMMAFFEYQYLKKEPDMLNADGKVLKESKQVRWESLLQSIRQEPFSCLSIFVIPFVHQLLPESKRALVSGFKNDLPILKPFFERSALCQTLTANLSDPFVLSFLEEKDLGSLFQRSMHKASFCLQELFSRLSSTSGEVDLGNTVAENALKSFIQEIQAAHRLRQELAHDKIEAHSYFATKKKFLIKEESLQAWLLIELPSLTPVLSRADRVLSLASSFMGITLGSFEMGSFFLSHVLRGVSEVLKIHAVADWIQDKMKGSGTDSPPDSPFAKLLRDHKQRICFTKFLQNRVIPLVLELVQVLQSQHDLQKYCEFFQYLDAVIKSDAAIDENELKKNLLKMVLQMVKEFEQYGPMIDHVFKSVLEKPAV